MNVYKLVVHHGRDLKHLREIVEQEVNAWLRSGGQVIDMSTTVMDIGDETEYVWLVSVAIVVREVQA